MKALLTASSSTASNAASIACSARMASSAAPWPFEFLLLLPPPNRPLMTFRVEDAVSPMAAHVEDAAPTGAVARVLVAAAVAKAAPRVPACPSRRLYAPSPRRPSPGPAQAAPGTNTHS